MPRKKRIWYPGAAYHVMSRGNRRTAIYKDEADYCHFLDIIKMTMKEYAFRVHSICMMTNHFHMEIETADVELWWIMQPFGPDYVPTELDWWWKDEPLINCPDRRVGVIGARRCTREDKEKCINDHHQRRRQGDRRVRPHCRDQEWPEDHRLCRHRS